MVVAATGTAHADDCAALGGVLAGGECQIPNAVTASDSAHGGPFTIDETLRIKGTGSIAVPPVKTGSSLTLLVTGNIIMDLPTVSGGGQIIGDNPLSGGVGATITVRATGDITLSGNGTVGAQISSNQGTSGCDDGRGGDIKLAAGGVFTLQKGAQITSIATCPGGNIAMTAGLSADIDGVVRTETKTTHGIGGRITITAGCTLTVGDAGQVVSTGRQTAGNRVHLEGGCAVLIQGLVASNGPGRDEKGLSQCHTPDRLDKPQDARGCIEVWSGGTLKIDSSSTHNAELNADTATSFAVTCCAWIDLFASGDITIIGNSTGSASIHANQTLPAGFGGMITIKSTGGNVSITGPAIEASDTHTNGSGGVVTIEAKGNATLDGAQILAQGDRVPPVFGAGGSVEVRAFSGALSWKNAPGAATPTGDVQPTGAGVIAGDRGTIVLNACSAIDVTGTAFPVTSGIATTPTKNTGLCPPAQPDAPTLPGYVPAHVPVRWAGRR